MKTENVNDRRNQMSELYGKWSVEDIREVIRGLDEKTGMNGASVSIYLRSFLGNGATLGVYYPSENNYGRFFAFSLKYFDNRSFNDLAAIDVIRHEYCHYLVDALGLKRLFKDENSHGIAWETVCGLLNTDQYGTYRPWYFPQATDDSFMNAYLSEDIGPVDIHEQLDRWGLRLPSLKRRRYLEKALVRKYTKLRVFSAGDSIFHDRFGFGKVLDTFPAVNKQFLYVQFERGEARIVQNRKVYKVVNGEVKKPG